MNKFTIFTIILTISVITVTADLALRERYSGSGQTSVLDIDYTENKEPEPETEPEFEPESIKEEPATEITPVENKEIIPQPKSLINANLVNSAGFAESAKEQQFNGKVFQLLDITKNPVDAVYLYQVSANGSPIVSITEIALRDEIRALQLYYLLQNKTKTYIDLTLNETNAYGDRSFYVNHGKKQDEAFLTVKIGSRLYAFAYVKSYHPQVKKLIELLAI